MPGPARTPVAERFWSKVNKAASHDCWEWTAAKKVGGYGKIGRPGAGNGWMLAHRFSWELAYGPIAGGMLVLHRCDNPSCVNPAHLFLGTNADNMRDMTAKGRSAKQRVTHCPSGHEYTPENTWRNKRGGRFCRACARLSGARVRERKRALAPPYSGPPRDDLGRFAPLVLPTLVLS